MTIPKIIHYCWFGSNDIPESVARCIESWKKYCPEYTIMRWDEKSFDVSAYKFTSEAYKKRKWAFVSDFARLKVVDEYGGFYLDTDVELLRSLDPLTKLRGFMGLESFDCIASGLCFGAEKGNKHIKALLDIYRNFDYQEISCGKITTTYFRTIGFQYKNTIQELDHFHIFPTEYFCPQLPGTRKIRTTENTYSVHYYNASWFSEKGLTKEIKYRRIFINMIIKKFLLIIVGQQTFEKLTNNVDISCDA
ncbi:glycosyltransferase family 32 protein [Enterococcus durans]|uniref:glycosyltransferase family 32 protein n=1 Tax=Enterococcus TaxID=1350 RepID=UPI0022E685B3|nr:glycosyltransferase [Enterococcus durans]